MKKQKQSYLNYHKHQNEYISLFMVVKIATMNIKNRKPIII